MNGWRLLRPPSSAAVQLAEPRTCDIISSISTITEIEATIENLPAPQVEALAFWLEKLRIERGTPSQVDQCPADYDEMARNIHTASMRLAIEQLDAGQGEELHAAMDDIRAEVMAMKAAQGTVTAR